MKKIFRICSRHVMANFELIKSNTFIRIVRIYIFVTKWSNQYKIMAKGIYVMRG